jgi:hypothetical protein
MGADKIIGTSVSDISKIGDIAIGDISSIMGEDVSSWADTTSLSYETDDYQESNTWDTIDGTSNFSVSLWFKTNSLAATQRIVTGYETGTDWNLYLKLNTAGIVTVWSGGSASNWTSSTANLVIDTWYHIVITLDASAASRYHKQKIYIDSVSGYTSNYYITNIPNGTTLAVGANPNYTHSAYFQPVNGYINELAIWGNYALDQTEIDEIYNLGKPNDLTTLTTPSPTNWWRSESGVWTGGSYYETTDEMGSGIVLTTNNMAEGSRVAEVP